MPYNTFIFDFDYTLADATEGIVASTNTALEQLGFAALEREPIRKTVGLTLREMFYTFTGSRDEALAAQFIALFKEKADAVMTDSTDLWPDTVEVLSLLKSKGFATAIVTSKNHYRIDEVLLKYNISGLVDYIVGFEDVRKPKPSPEGLLNAIEFFGTDKASVLYVGDSLIDARTAQNAEVDFAAVLTGTTTVPEFEPFPRVCAVQNLTELLAFVNKE